MPRNWLLSNSGWVARAYAVQPLGHTAGLREKRLAEGAFSHPEGWQDWNLGSARSDNAMSITVDSPYSG